jgi:hypothetical protein
MARACSSFCATTTNLHVLNQWIILIRLPLDSNPIGPLTRPCLGKLALIQSFLSIIITWNLASFEPLMSKSAGVFIRIVVSRL